MIKKKVKKSVGKKTSSNKDRLLIENLVSLQKVLLNLSVKLESLSEQTSKLLALFEISAKSFAEKQGGISKEDKEFVDKLNQLMEQNKILAKGLTLMEEKLRVSNSQMPPQNRHFQRP
ncbi:MAG: hypothetical protein QXI33_01620 [Candidatus Pacearchaeota archaeon]